MTKIMEEVQQLSLDEQLELIENIWRVVLETKDEPLDETETKLLKDRARDAIQNPQRGRTWVEIRAELGAQ
jgi:putative addiction module component (TIGR02574 family)